METAIATQAKRAARLEAMGFKTAAKELSELLERKRKLALAYENYRFVTQENVAAFNKKLLEKTGKNMDNPITMQYQVLAFTPIADYATVPPEDVLAKLEVAQGRNCFDAFEVAYIKNVKDPILFGRVHGTPNRFYIADWDSDVCISDLIKENEG